ncbi:hypothetical protein L7F22_039259 [Adiantum nelumboides]|nr:hypothetical protein [Adiantum nelumboides]
MAGSSSSSNEDSDLEEERSLTVLYATQSGNAQDVAERIGRQARRRHVHARIHSMDEYDIVSLKGREYSRNSLLISFLIQTNLINESLVILIVATTGNGDFPTSALSFWRFLLRSDLPQDILSDVTFATFALGDSSYKRFCWPARKINKRLKGLGAYEIIEGGEADDQHYLGIDGTLRPWLDTLWTTLDDVLPSASNNQTILPDDHLLPPAIDVQLATNTNGHAKGNGTINGNTNESFDTGWITARLTKNERITAEDHWQDVRLIEFEEENGEYIEFRPTDVLSVVPENGEKDVTAMLDRLGWTEAADQPLLLTPTNKEDRIPNRLLQDQPLTLRKLLTKHLDFKSVPRPSFFERILPFTPADHMQHEKLQEYCTPGEGADDMYEYAIRVRRTILEVLQEFDAVQIPIGYVLDIFPLLRRREFSIANAPTQHIDGTTNKIQLCVAIVDYKTRLKDRRIGVCTSWLSKLQSGTRIPISITPSAMPTQALRNHSAPAIFVGPGTGIAPVRSALWDRFAILKDSMKAEDNLCFFGFRNKSKDFLFGEEWNDLASKRCITSHLAASRDQEEKVYVQDLIKKESKQIWNVISNPKGLVYVCGSAGKMPQAVRASIVEACCTHGDMEEEQAEDYINQIETQGRWIEECWD